MGDFAAQSCGPSGMNYYFAAGGCMSERIRHRCEKTSLWTTSRRAPGCQDSAKTNGMMRINCFFVTRPYA
jgi:hypothetical protein